MKTLFLGALLVSAVAMAKPVRRPITYSVDKVPLEGVLLFDDAVKTPRPGLLLVPNWLGINEANLKQAELVAGTKYVVFVADMYGKANRPKNMDEAGKAAGALKADTKLMRARAYQAMETLVAQAKDANLDVKKLGATGFCFGGTVALELARAGSKANAVVTFHAGLATSAPATSIAPKVLVLHGADDPTVPEADVKAFIGEMRGAKADWQLVSFGNSVHSFTDVDAKVPGRSEYNPVVAKRAYQMADNFFAEAFGG